MKISDDIGRDEVLWKNLSFMSVVAKCYSPLK